MISTFSHQNTDQQISREAAPHSFVLPLIQRGSKALLKHELCSNPLIVLWAAAFWPPPSSCPVNTMVAPWEQNPVMPQLLFSLSPLPLCWMWSVLAEFIYKFMGDSPHLLKRLESY